MTNKPTAVCISDIHFNINTLPLASAALTAALLKAQQLRVPLIIAGDLNDTKAIIRAEVANALIAILKDAYVKVYILEGNHDKINEKGSEHGLEYLSPYATIIDEVTYMGPLTFIPYQNDSEKLKIILSEQRKDQLLIMHQGFLGAFMGDYVQDKTSIDPTLAKNFKVISGHYHKHQTVGTVTYIGSPYTITFGEANDGPKGFLILNQDGTFTREVLSLRKHLIVERDLESLTLPIAEYNQGDLVWIKVTGIASELSKIDKRELGNKLFGHSNYKLDLIANSSEPSDSDLRIESMSDSEVFDAIIDRGPETEQQKKYLKDLWKGLI